MICRARANAAGEAFGHFAHDGRAAAGAAILARNIFKLENKFGAAKHTRFVFMAIA